MPISADRRLLVARPISARSGLSQAGPRCPFLANFCRMASPCERRKRAQKKTSAETELLGQVRDIPELVVLDFANTDQYSKLRGAT